jgi:hypothetical protein
VLVAPDLPPPAPTAPCQDTDTDADVAAAVPLLLQDAQWYLDHYGICLANVITRHHTTTTDDAFRLPQHFDIDKTTFRKQRTYPKDNPTLWKNKIVQFKKKKKKKSVATTTTTHQEEEDSSSFSSSSEQQQYYFVLHTPKDSNAILLIPVIDSGVTFTGKTLDGFPRYVADVQNDNSNWTVACQSMLQLVPRERTRLVGKTKFVAKEAWAILEPGMTTIMPSSPSGRSHPTGAYCGRSSRSSSSTKPKKIKSLKPAKHCHFNNVVMPTPIDDFCSFNNNTALLSPGVYCLATKKPKTTDPVSNVVVLPESAPARPPTTTIDKKKKTTTTTTTKLRLIMTRKTYNAERQTWTPTEHYLSSSSSNDDDNQPLLVQLARGGQIKIFPNHMDNKTCQGIRNELLGLEDCWRSYDIQGGPEPRLHCLLYGFF